MVVCSPIAQPFPSSPRSPTFSSQSRAPWLRAQHVPVTLVFLSQGGAEVVAAVVGPAGLGRGLALPRLPQLLLLLRSPDLRRLRCP